MITREYYEAKWEGGQKRGIDEEERLRFIISSVKKIARNKTLNIIDLGCGYGWITNALTKYGTAIGVDLSIKKAKQLYPNCLFIEADAVNGNILGKYDIVVSSEVLEHLPVPDQPIYIKNAYSLLADNGYLILTTPNRPQVRALFRAFPNTPKQPIENWLSKKELCGLLSPFFNIVYTGSIVPHPISIRGNSFVDSLYVSSRLITLAGVMLNRSTIGLYLTVVAQKKELPSG